MAVIYLKHPVHGEKVEANEACAEIDRANGWVEFAPAQPAAPVLPWQQPVSDLPADFPGREALIAGGLVTWASVVGKSIEDLRAVRGITIGTAKAIIKAVE